MIHYSHSISDTQKLAQEIANKIPSRILALVGDLGSGKTTFSQFFLRALGVEGRITSPTFVIIKNYILKNKELGIRNYERVYHIDCYRVKNPEELLALGFREILDNHRNIVLIEWADKVKELIPKDALWIKFEHGKSKHERTITT